MTTLWHVVLLIVLLVSLGNTPTNAKLSIDVGESIIKIQTMLSENVRYNCGSAGSFAGSSGSTSQIAVASSTNTECDVLRSSYNSVFLAHDVAYDQNHIFIFWQIRSDGLYHSWDEQSWVKRANWNPSF